MTLIKPLILSLLVGIASIAKAEINGTFHWPRSGDMVTKQHYEFVEMAADTTLWDFSQAIETGKSHDMRWLTLGDTVLVRFERGAQSTYTVHGDSLLWRSQESPLIGMRDSIAPLVLYGGFPAIGDSLCSPCYFSGKYCGNNAVAFKGMHMTKTMAVGTLVLPGDTIHDAILVREVTDGVMKTSAHAMERAITDENGLLRHTVVTDRWYAPDCRYEIAENVSSIYRAEGRTVQEENATFLCSRDAQQMALGKIEIPLNAPLQAKNKRNGGNGDNGLTLSDRVSIHVTEGEISVTVSGDSCGTTAANAVTVILSDISGRVWASQAGSAESGCFSTNINTSSLPSGNYVLYINTGNESYNNTLFFH